MRNTSTSTFLEDLEVNVFTPDHVILEVVTTSEPTRCIGGAAGARQCRPGQYLLWEIETLSPGDVRELRVSAQVDDEVRRGSLVTARSESRFFLGSLSQQAGATVVFMIGNSP